MKKILLSTLVIAGVFTLGLTLSSNANGPGGNRTGSPGSSGNCGSCHSGGNFSGQLKVGIVEIGDTNFIASYTPGKAYEIWVKIKGTSSKMGFQATVISSSASNSIGTLGTAPTGTTKYNSSTKVIWGHTTPSSTGSWRIGWTAPAAGAGSATVYSSCVLANSNNNDNGDQVVPASKTITEATSSNTKDIANDVITVLGNPAKDVVRLSQSVLSMAIWNQSGQMVAKSNNSNECNIQNLPAGNYYLQILKNNHKHELIQLSVK